MSRKWQGWKMWTSIALALLLAADIGLGIFLWQTARQAPAQMRSQRALLATQAKLLKADVVRGEKIRGSLPLVKNDCDSFYRQSFLDASAGYSGIESDLDSIAVKAGVKTSGFKFDQKEVKGRGVAEISVTTSVEADYPSLMEFIDGLERSRNFYLLDQLSLTSATAGAIRLQVGLHTYFRT